MYANQYYNVSGQQVSQLPINMMKADGYFKGATADRWLQFFDSCIAPAAGAVPVREETLPQTAPFYFEFKNGAMPFYEGLWVGVSSTEGTYTANSDAMDICIETDVQPIATNIVGDKTTARGFLQVWTQAAGFAADKVLYGLIITEQLGQAQEILIFSDDASQTNPQAYIPLAANATIKVYFGTSGKSFFSQTLPPAIPPTAANPTQGCNVGASTVGNYGPPNIVPYPWTQTGGNAVTILAITN